MKRRTALIRITAWIAVVIAAGALFLWRTSSKIGKPADAERAAYTADHGPTLPQLWDSPAFTLANERGSMSSEQELRGKVWIADFVFTTCTAVCPRITAGMVRLQNRLTDSRLRFVSFAVDPEHDTVEALAKYKQSWNAGDTRWTLLRPSPRELTRISDAMRVAIEPSDDVTNPILHSSMFFLVDEVGKVRGVYNSSDEQAQQRLIEDAGALLATLPPAASAPVAASLGDVGLDPNSGHGLYLKLGCRACHERPQLAPSLSGLKDRPTMLASGKQIVADRQYVERALLDPSHEMVAGYLELMPSYRGELQGEKLTRLVDYLLEGAGDAAPPPASSVSPSAASASAAMVDPRATRPGPNASGNTTSSASSPSSTLPAATLEVDPVCNMDVRVVDGTPQATHEGHTYHFCSEGCRERFAKDPSKFLPQK